MTSDPYSVTDAIFWGDLVQQAYDLYSTAQGSLTPPIPAKPGIPQGWNLIYYLAVNDQVLFFEKTSSIGYILQNPTANCFGILFRGTDNTLEWIVDVEAVQTDFTVNNKTYGNVEAGFLGELDNVSVLTPAGAKIGPFVSWLNTLSGTDAAIFVAGHSLGAAIATLAGAQAAIQGNPTKIFSFASPQVGDSHFAASFDGLPLDHYRLYNLHDLVPKLPSTTLGYGAVEIGIPIDTTTKDIKTSLVCCHSLTSYLAVLGSTNYGISPDCALPG